MANSTYPAYGGKGWQILTVNWVLIGLGTFLISLWAYARLAIARKGGWALFWASCYWLAGSITTSFVTAAVLHGLGNHIDVVKQHGKVSELLLYSWTATFFFIIDIPIGKIAATALLLSILEGTKPVLRKVLILNAAITVLLSLPSLVLCYVHCKPVSAIFDPARQHRCNVQPAVDYWYFQSAWCIADAIQTTAAFLIVWPLQMSKPLKIGTCCLLSFGVLAVITTIARSVQNRHLLSEDFSYNATDLFIWSKVEELVVLVVSCVPPAYPSLKQIYRRLVSAFRPAAQDPPLELSVLDNQGRASRHRRGRTPSRESLVRNAITPAGTEFEHD